MACITNSGNWCQVTFPTGEGCIRVIGQILRRWGYRVSTRSLGSQITSVGVVKMTLLDIRPGSNPDTFGSGDCIVNDCILTHSAHLGDF